MTPDHHHHILQTARALSTIAETATDPIRGDAMRLAVQALHAEIIEPRGVAGHQRTRVSSLNCALVANVTATGAAFSGDDAYDRDMRLMGERRE